MWIRLLLLVGFAVGLNWIISMEIRKQQKQLFLNSEVKKLYSSNTMQKDNNKL